MPHLPYPEDVRRIMEELRGQSLELADLVPLFAAAAQHGGVIADRTVESEDALGEEWFKIRLKVRVPKGTVKKVAQGSASTGSASTASASTGSASKAATQRGTPEPREPRRPKPEPL